jgi:hypothetical protein
MKQIKLIATDRMLKQHFQSPNPISDDKRQFFLLRTDRYRRLAMESFTLSLQLSHDEFLAKLAVVAEPYIPALFDRRQAEDVKPATLRNYHPLQYEESWHKENMLTEAQRWEWSYRPTEELPEAGMKAGDWRPLATPDAFQRFRKEMEDPSARAVFCRVSAAVYTSGSGTNVLNLSSDTSRAGSRASSCSSCRPGELRAMWFQFYGHFS